MHSYCQQQAPRWQSLIGSGPNLDWLGSTKPGLCHRLNWLCGADIARITHKHIKGTYPQRPKRSAVGYRSICAENCIFIAIIKYGQEELNYYIKA
jgi:hypothetical protein